MKEELGIQQVMEMHEALLAAVLTQTGPVSVTRDDLRQCFAEKRTVRAAYTPDSGTWTLSAEVSGA